MTAWYNSWVQSSSNVKGQLVITSNVNEDDTITVFNVTSISPTTGYYRINVTYVTGTIPTAAEACVVSFLEQVM